MPQKFKNQLLTCAGFLIFLALSACSTFSVDEAKLKSTKKVAIVGFDIQQQRPVQALDIAASLVRVKTKDGPTMAERRDSSHVERTYKNLSERLKKEENLVAIPIEALRVNPSYATLFRDKTEGWQSRPQMDSKFDLYTVPGVLDSWAIRTTSEALLKKLQNDLQVDALISVTSTVQLNNNSAFASLVGQGEFHPSAVTYLRMLDMRTGQEIWMDSNAEGDKINSGEKNFLGLAADDKVNELAVQATDSSFRVLMNHLNAKVVR